jgi:hypothetical protein
MGVGDGDEEGRLGVGDVVEGDDEDGAVKLLEAEGVGDEVGKGLEPGGVI